MRHGVAGRKLNRPTEQRMLMLRNLVTDLLRHESLQTTEARAKEVKRMADKVITCAKRGTLHDRRQALAVLTDEHVVSKLFDELKARYQSRPGGYCRIVKVGTRKGDAAPMAVIELVK